MLTVLDHVEFIQGGADARPIPPGAEKVSRDPTEMWLKDQARPPLPLFHSGRPEDQ
jgi:hypothetical protein